MKWWLRAVISLLAEKEQNRNIWKEKPIVKVEEESWREPYTASGYEVNGVMIC